MKYLIILLTFLSCQKQESPTIPQTESVDNIFPSEAKPGRGKGNQPAPTPEPTPTVGTTLLYIDMDGEPVNHSYWGNFFAKAPVLTTSQKIEIPNFVSALYATYNVIVTTDRYRYDTTSLYNKIKIIVTDTAIRSGTGVAVIGSYRNGSETVAFVFSGKLLNNSKYIGDIAAHEAGHAFGLNHQTECVNGVITNQWRNGAIMGMPYYTNPAQWVTGTNNYCYPQNDHQLLSNKLGLR